MSISTGAVGTVRDLLRRPWVGGTVGVVVLIAIWWTLTVLNPEAQRAFPTPPMVVQAMISDGWAFYGPNLADTLSRAGQGYLWGNLIALALASVVLVIPQLEAVITQFGVISSCLPITAIGPIMMLMFGGPTSAVFLAALLVFFTTLVGAILGMKSASKTSLELVSAYGGSRWTQIKKVQLIAAVPAIITALQLAIPGALLGAVVGEYLGGIDRGIGVAISVAQREIMPDRLWALSILVGLISLAGYMLVGVIGRALTPWASEVKR
ncbi:MAG: ABC transporter permease [Mycetocola sp.]